MKLFADRTECSEIDFCTFAMVILKKQDHEYRIAGITRHFSGKAE